MNVTENKDKRTDVPGMSSTDGEEQAENEIETFSEFIFLPFVFLITKIEKIIQKSSILR